MNSGKTSYPLYWPEGRKRTSFRRSSNFKTDFGRARDNLLNELKLLGGSDIVLSTNIPLRLDGLPMANFRVPSDTGAALYFKRKGKEMCFACDEWNQVSANLHAIALTIGALRGIARWGTGDMMEAAFRGFMAIPERTGGPDWWTTLGVPVNAESDQVKEAYRILVKKHHPDAGGDPELFRRVREAFEAFEALVKHGRAA